MCGHTTTRLLYTHFIVALNICRLSMRNTSIVVPQAATHHYAHYRAFNIRNISNYKNQLFGTFCLGLLFIFCEPQSKALQIFKHDFAFKISCLIDKHQMIRKLINRFLQFKFAANFLQNTAGVFPVKFLL